MTVARRKKIVASQHQTLNIGPFRFNGFCTARESRLPVSRVVHRNTPQIRQSLTNDGID
jgi:hypothetical protein